MKSLKNKAEFDFVYKNSRKYYGECFHSYILTFSHPSLKERQFSFKERRIFSKLLASQDALWIGLSVSKKMGNAPTRNKIKRRFRAFCRIHQEDLRGKAIVFVAKDAKNLDFKRIEEEMFVFLKRKSEKF